jgi:hypothetical protein
MRVVTNGKTRHTSLGRQPVPCAKSWSRRQGADPLKSGLRITAPFFASTSPLSLLCRGRLFVCSISSLPSNFATVWFTNTGMFACSRNLDSLPPGLKYLAMTFLCRFYTKKLLRNLRRGSCNRQRTCRIDGRSNREPGLATRLVSPPEYMKKELLVPPTAAPVGLIPITSK